MGNGVEERELEGLESLEGKERHGRLRGLALGGEVLRPR
jgi:hypothetical protein